MAINSSDPVAGRLPWWFGFLFLVGAAVVMLLAARLGGNWFILAGGLWFVLFAAIRCRPAYCPQCKQIRVFLAAPGHLAWWRGAKCPICGAPYPSKERKKP
jgi:hypothetical protein